MTRNSDIKDIREHIDVINKELGTVNVKIARIETSWNYMKYIVGLNVTLWVLVLGLLLRHGI